MRKPLQKIICCLLAMTLSFYVLPLNTIASAEKYTEMATQSVQLDDAEPITAGVGGKVETNAEYILGEDESKRGASYKEFALSNGLRLAVIYPYVVHYEENGRWKEIDNTLVSTTVEGKTVYTNAAGSLQVRFPQTLGNDGNISVSKGGYTLSFGVAGELRRNELVSAVNGLTTANAGDVTTTYAVAVAQNAGAQLQQVDIQSLQATVEYAETICENISSGVVYPNVYTNTNIVYELISNSVKESIIIRSYDAALRGYQYTLNTGTMIPVLREDGHIDLYAPNRQDIIFTMPAPYMVDNNGVYTYDVDVTLTGKDGVYTLSYLMPTSWLAAEDRAWPVILDPIVQEEGSATTVQDVTVAEFKDIAYTVDSLLCGWVAGYGIMRSYVKFENLPELTAADVIVDATVSLRLRSSCTTSPVVEVHKVQGTWTSSTMTWANKVDYDSMIEDYVIPSSAGQYSWHITDVVREWYASGVNTGLMFKASDAIEAAATDHYIQFYASDYSKYSSEYMPTLNIKFRNSNGLESYWDYTASSAGRAGTGYVNNYSGNLTWVHSDIGFGGNRMPVTISHIYNANDSGSNTYGMGNGWRTNYNQTITKIENEKINAAYVWEDGDGTQHYFIADADGTLRDEDGLELILTVTNSAAGNYTITDKYGNTSRFENGKLRKLVNNQAVASEITINYQNTSSNLISYITDGVGRRYNFTYTNGLLTRISYIGTGTTEIAYVTFGYTGNNLTSITDKDGKQSQFGYTGSIGLTSATDIDGYTLTYTYSAGSPKRVVGISEADGTAEGGTLSIEYAHNQTTFTDHNGNVQIMQFNDWGNVISVQDNEGRAQFAEYDLNAFNESAGDSNVKGNQLRLSSKLQNTVSNMLIFSSFEENATWYNISSVVSFALSTEAAYIGERSLKMTRATAGTASGVYSSGFTAQAGKSYTFSAYVKTGSGATAYLAISDSANAVVTSQTLPANSDWIRLEVTYHNTTSSSKTISVRLLTTTAGTVYMDCVQLEEAPTASRYNLIENGDFRSTLGWSASSGRTTAPDRNNDGVFDVATPQLSNNVYSFTGNPATVQQIYQTIRVSGTAGDTFVLSGWASGDSAPLTDANRTFSLWGVFSYTDGTQDLFPFDFNSDADSSVNWQYVAGSMVAKKDYNEITVFIRYDYNVNTVYFDGIQLFKESFGSSYTYDANGNVTAELDILGQTTEYTYDNNKLEEIKQNGVSKMIYTYDNYFNVLTATSANGVVYTYTYDAYGNNLTVSVGSGTSKITSSATYSTDGNVLVSTKDALDKETKYGYNVDTNVLEWVQYPNDTDNRRTTYTYDEMYRLEDAVTAVDSGYNLTASYSYTDDLLTTITTGSTTYSFSYGVFSQRSSIKIGSRTLATYSYTNDQNRYLDTMAYGSGTAADKVRYTYDDKGRVVAEAFYENGSTTVSRTITYVYDNTGALATVTDSETGITTTYYYDFTDRLMKYVESSAGYSHSVGYEYDTLNNLTRLVETINGVEHTTTYTYDSDNRITVMVSGGITQNYTYDTYGRLSRNDVGIAAYTYIYRSSSSGKPTGQVGTKRLLLNGANSGVSFSYTYDDNGNILTVIDGTHITSYVYDSANQLVRENNQAAGKTWTWSYDDAGNILTKKEYAYTTGTLGAVVDSITYTYGDTSWGDLLTAYDGVPISYDQVGNPLSDGTWTYTWKQGRQLATMAKSGTTWNFAYDANGMRTSRSDGSTTYTYVYNGGQLSQMYAGTNMLTFTYDASGHPATVKLANTTYYYVTNLQGDVVAIVNSAGTQVVSYTYDAWGRPLTTSGTMALSLGRYNPLRYRGYVYDQESGLYYLQSRYYNPQTGRFLNADSSVTTGQGLLGNNMFAYCLNSPTNGCDPCGNCFHNWSFTDCEKCAAFWSTAENAWDSVMEWCTNAYDYVTNTSEAVVLNSTGISFYRGTMVIRANIGSHGGGASYGIIVLDDNYRYDKRGIDTLKHEYGHFEHMNQIGIVAYTVTTAIPSLIGAGIADYRGTGIRKFLSDHYKSQPWERIADHLGGVTGETYLPGADTIGSLYWLYTQFVGMALS